MALTYQESAQLMGDIAFNGRIQVACLHFAEYIVGEAPSTPAHTTRMRWAQGTFQNPTAAATQVQPATVMEPGVQAQGAAISDPDLQTAVETAVNKMI